MLLPLERRSITMKRTLVIVTLCLLLAATVGTTAVVAKQADSTSQAGTTPVYQFDVSPSGKIVIIMPDTGDKPTYVYSGEGFVPGETYILQFHITGVTGAAPIGSGVASPEGVVVIVGTIDSELVQNKIMQNEGDFLIGQHVL